MNEIICFQYKVTKLYYWELDGRVIDIEAREGYIFKENKPLEVDGLYELICVWKIKHSL